MARTRTSSARRAPASRPQDSMGCVTGTMSALRFCKTERRGCNRHRGDDSGLGVPWDTMNLAWRAGACLLAMGCGQTTSADEPSGAEAGAAEGSRWEADAPERSSQGTDDASTEESGSVSSEDASGWPQDPACALPFDPGPCKAAMGVFAFVDGSCALRTYGGCDGNANRFDSEEECMAACLGRPVPRGCTGGRTRQTICLQCGVVGGCGKQADVCAMPCGADLPACPAPFSCGEGVCRAFGCS